MSAQASMKEHVREDEAWREHTAAEVVTEFRAAVLELDPATLSERECVISYGILTKLKNRIDRRSVALRKGIDALFAGELELRVTDRAREIAHQILFDGDSCMLGDAITVRLLNKTFGLKALSVERALALLGTKKRSALKMAMEKPPRPPQPPPRFSAEKFRELVAKGVITQAEYDACIVCVAPQGAVTVDVPPEIEVAIAATLLRPAPVDLYSNPPP